MPPFMVIRELASRFTKVLSATHRQVTSFYPQGVGEDTPSAWLLKCIQHEESLMICVSKY